MKVLVTYYSGTGNTEKVAKAIKEGIKGHEVDLLNIKGADPNSIGTYDLVFIGSGLFAFNISRKLPTFLKKIPSLPPKFAYFYTHEAPQKGAYPNCFKSVNTIIEKSNCEVLGTFDCCGENLVEKAQEQREAMMNRLSPEERQKSEEAWLNLVKGHPNAQDLENAKSFAASIINKFP
ncbi:MAG: flavodoxin family protein, partial [Promethearchaeota archaeon]